MKIAGIVCEYNPFHSGHKWMIEEIKKQGYDAVVCVMSAYFVQRGEPALFTPGARVRAALLSGADLVLRLPADAALRSAEGFAYSSVGILSALGCVDSIFFGAETPDTDLLYRCAEILSGEDFSRRLKAELDKGCSFPAARSRALKTLMPEGWEILNSPNNILAVEYCKALLHGYDFAKGISLPKGRALPRLGADHDGAPRAGTASASWLRSLFVEKGAHSLKSWVPGECMAVYTEEAEKANYADYNSWERLLVSRLKGMTAENFINAYGGGEGIENRMEEAVRKGLSSDEIFRYAKSKRFTHSRLRRLAVTAALGFNESNGKTPSFIHVMGAGDKGLEVLKEAKSKSCLPYGTSLARLEKTSSEAYECARREARAEDIFSYCLKKPQKGGGVYTQPCIIM